MRYLLRCEICDIMFEDIALKTANCPLCGQDFVEKKASYPDDQDEEDFKEPLIYR